MKFLKNIVVILAFLVVLGIFYIFGAIFYAWWTDFIPKDVNVVEATTENTDQILVRDTLNFLDWNIGYGGLGEESDFFYEGGVSVNMPKTIVEKNLRGIVQTLERFKDSMDFFLLQEVDIESKRTHWINQFELISESLKSHNALFGKNYDVKYIPFPLTNPMGKVMSGIATWSKYKVKESLRHSFKGNYNFPHNLFFLDRCFMLKRYPTKNGKELIVVNTHNSAYDDGTLKKKQMKQMQSILIDEFEKGNYVIIGGDWNQFPNTYPDEEKKKYCIPENYPAKGWQCSYDPKTPTYRNLSEPYDPTSTTTGLIDFYVVSPNVEVLDVSTIDQQFKYSDHQPVLMKAVLN